MGDGEGVPGDRTAPGITEVDATLEVVSNDIRTEGDSVGVAVEDDGGAVALFDHVAGNDRSVGVFDHDAVPQMVVDVVAVHAEIERIETPQGIEILLKVVGINHDVVTAPDLDTAPGIVGDDVVADPGILVAVIEMDAVSAIVVDREPAEKNFLNPVRPQSVAAFGIATDAEIAKLDPPDACLGVRGYGGAEQEGRLTRLVFVQDMGGSAGTFDAGLGSFDNQRRGDFVISGGNGDEAAGDRQGIEGRLERGVGRRIDPHRRGTDRRCGRVLGSGGRHEEAGSPGAKVEEMAVHVPEHAAFPSSREVA